LGKADIRVPFIISLDRASADSGKIFTQPNQFQLDVLADRDLRQPGVYTANRSGYSMARVIWLPVLTGKKSGWPANETRLLASRRAEAQSAMATWKRWVKTSVEGSAR
jgi:hypothetical protein